MRVGDIVQIRSGVRPYLSESAEDVAARDGDLEAWRRERDVLDRPDRVSEFEWVVEDVVEPPNPDVVFVCLSHDPRGEFSYGDFCVYVDRADLI